MTWDEYFLEIAHVVAKKSKDRSTQIGAVVVGPDNEIRGTGFNGMPRGIDDNIQERHERPLKLSFFAHGEQNAIDTAARNGVSFLGCSLYCTAPSCSKCARSIIQSGIRKVYFPIDHPFKDRPEWVEDCKIGVSMLMEAGVIVIWLR
jgi:dCMP deaminase